jgi:hypothetical protein
MKSEQLSRCPSPLYKMPLTHASWACADGSCKGKKRLHVYELTSHWLYIYVYVNAIILNKGNMTKETSQSACMRQIKPNSIFRKDRFVRSPGCPRHRSRCETPMTAWSAGFLILHALDSGVHDLPWLLLRTGTRRVGTKRDQAETAALLPASSAEDSVLLSHHHGAVRPDQRAWRCVQALVRLTLVQPALDQDAGRAQLRPRSLPSESCWTSNRSCRPCATRH